MAGRSGIGRYVTELVGALRRLDSIDLQLLGKEAECSMPLDAPVFSLGEQRQVPTAARRVRADLLHVPHFNAPWFAGMPMVVTIHDVAYLDHPEWLPSRAKRLVYGMLLREAARRADAVIVPSQFSKQRLCECLNIAPGRVSVVPLAASRFCQPPVTGSGLPVDEHVLSRPYFLYVGNVRPHKNLPVLLDAFDRLRRRYPELRLIVVGEAQPGYGVLNEVAERGVIYLGVQSDAVVHALYARALAFVFPSRYEGFGLPPLEAMAAGCPVICSSAASLPEVVGQAALLFDPDAVDELAGQMERIVTEPSLGAALRDQGAERVQHFSWDRTAMETLAVYEQTLAAKQR